MTIQELIKELSYYPPDLKVVVNGYEGGYDDIILIKKIGISRNVIDKWYYGKYNMEELAPDEFAVSLTNPR